MQIGGYKPDEIKPLTLKSFKQDLEPGFTRKSGTLKDDYRFYDGADPFSFGSVDEYEVLPNCTKPPSRISRGASADEQAEFNEQHREYNSCQERHAAVLRKSFTFSELVKDLDSSYFGSGFYIVTDIKSQLSSGVRVTNNDNTADPRIQCGFTQIDAGTLIEEVSKYSKTLRFLRILNSNKELVKAFFIYENGTTTDNERIFIPIRNAKFLSNVMNDTLETSVEMKSTVGGRRRSSRKYKKSNRRIKSSKKRSYTTKYSRTRHYRK